MPGFGYGSWGESPFGEWWWSRYVFYDLLPSLYREQDTTGFLEKYAESLRPSFDQLRRKMRDFGEMRDPLLVRSAVSEQQTVRFGKKVTLRGGIEQSGVDGRVSVYGEFRTPTGRFTNSDRGKEITVRRSDIPANNKSVTIVSVVDSENVVVLPRLDIDNGPLRWEVREVFEDPPNRTTIEIRSGGAELGKVAGGWLVNDGSASFPVLDRKVFIVPAGERDLLTEREGIEDGTIDSSGRLSAPYYQFSYADVGKIILLSGSVYSENNGRYEIFGVDKLSPTDYRAVFSRLDVDGIVALGGAHDGNGTVRYANKPGKAARIFHVLDGLNTPFSISVLDEDITVTLATDALGNAASLANAVVSAINAHGQAGLLVTASAPGSGTGFVGPTDALVFVPGTTPQADSKLTWALTPFGRLVLRGPAPAGLVTADGIDGFLEPVTPTQGRLKTLASAPFVAGDVGKLLIIRGSLVGNDGVFEVVDVPAYGGGSVATLDGVFATEPNTNLLFWELRVPSGQADRLSALASAPSMLSVFAKDFGIEVDTQESEARQRSWVKYVNEWVDKKGLAKSYDILATISGYTSTVSQLFRITYDLSTELPPDAVFEVSDRFGEDGSLVAFSGDTVDLLSPTGGFELADVGRYVRIQTGANAANNQLFVVDSINSPTSARIRALQIHPPVPPDPNNGTLRWAILRVYTDLPPSRPNFDEFDSDLMATLVPGLTVDTMCWEIDIRLGVGAEHTASSNTGEIFFGGDTLVDTFAAPFVIGDVGRVVQITDGAGANNGFYLISAFGSADTVTLSNLDQTAIAWSASAQDLSYVVFTSTLNVRATFVSSLDSSFVWVDGDIAVVTALGVWALTDSTGRTGFLESVPLPVPDITLGTGDAAITYVGFDPSFTAPLKVAHYNPGPNNPTTTVSVVNSTSTYLMLTLRTDGGGAVLTTPQEIQTVILNTPATAILVVTAFPYRFDGSLPVVNTPGSPNGAMVTLTSDLVDSTTNPFTVGDVGKVLQIISGAGVDNGYYLISAYVNPSTVTVTNLDSTPKLWADTLAGIPYVVYQAFNAGTVRRTTIASGIPMAVGPAGLAYECEMDLSCDYCVSYRVLLALELDTLANEEGVALERTFERTLKRLADVTPAHVELVPRIIQPLTATLNLQATIEPVETLAVLFAPLAFYFDEVEADGTSPVPPPPYYPTHTILTGTLTFGNGSPAVTGVGTAFTAELETYMTVRLGTAPDSALADILSITDDFNLTLSVPYAGPSGSGLGVRGTFRTLTGTVTFTNGSATVTGVGTSFTTELFPYSYVRLGSDTDAALVKVATTPDNLTLTLVSPYVGTSGSGVAITANNPFDGSPGYDIDPGGGPTCTITTP